MPQKVKCFIWLVIKHKVLLRDLLQCRGFQGPDRCIMCKHDGEMVEHLFCHSPLFQSLWIYICLGLGVTWSWNHNTCIDLIKAMADHLVLSLDIIYSFMWAFWLARNRMIFQNFIPNFHAMIVKLCAMSSTVIWKRPRGRMRPISLFD